MKTIYFTITGTGYYNGSDFLEKDMKVFLEKDKDNEYDTEAILVKLPGVGEIGYVANSPRTVLGESMSAGRIYDKIGNLAEGKILYKLSGGVLGELEIEESEKDEKRTY